MNKGFTLVELLIVVAIIASLILVSLNMYGNLQASTQLNENTSQLVQVIRTAREQSLAGWNNNQHGVFILLATSTADQYTLYQGASYATRTASFDRTTIMDNALNLSATGFVLTSGNIDINFSQGTGLPSATGTIIISQNFSNSSRSININNIGLVEGN